MDAFFDSVPLRDVTSAAGAHAIQRRRKASAPLIILLLALLVSGITSPLGAQQTEDEARSFIESIAEMVYNLGWPTATYEGFRLGGFRDADGGFDVGIRLYGRSGWNNGPLWMDLVLQLRNGALHDIVLDGHNAILQCPFCTLGAIAAAVAEVAEETAQPRSQYVTEPGPGPSAAERRTASLLYGTWRDENSVFSYDSQGRWHSRWDGGSEASGTWTLRGDTLTWYADGRVFHAYRLISATQTSHVMESLTDRARWNAQRIR